jgi:signal transduction histidine kinase/ActR/RegA family two-component response regulator
MRLRRHQPKLDTPQGLWLMVGVISLAGALVAEWLSEVAIARVCCLVAAWAAASVYLFQKTSDTALYTIVKRRDEALVQLQRAKGAAEVASRAKSEFLAVMSHEIRTPLTAVVGFANVLSETRLTPTQQRYVGTIINAGERLANLVNDILDFSKIEEGKMTIEQVPFSPALIVHEVIELLSPRATSKGLTVHFDNQIGNALTLIGDPARVRQVLMNLFSNAVKFTDSGAVTISGHWSANPRDVTKGQLHLAVADTGIGIATDKLPKLFCYFSQADASTFRRFGGSGLGLAICKKLVELMGGCIEVRSSEGKGSTFSFNIPAQIVPEEIEAPTLCPSHGTAAPFDPEKRVLIVDDQELNRELMRLLLRRCGYAADLAATGEDAVRMAGQRSYVAIFMDLEMPGKDGFTATTEIRRREQGLSHVPIVAVTAITTKGTREKCLAAGMDEYLAKPIYVPAMKSTLDALVERSCLAPAGS